MLMTVSDKAVGTTSRKSFAQSILAFGEVCPIIAHSEMTDL